MTQWILWDGPSCRDAFTLKIVMIGKKPPWLKSQRNQLSTAPGNTKLKRPMKNSKNGAALKESKTKNEPINTPMLSKPCAPPRVKRKNFMPAAHLINGNWQPGG